MVARLCLLALVLGAASLAEARRDFREEPLFNDQDVTGGDTHTVSAGAKPNRAATPQQASSLLPLKATATPSSARGLPQPINASGRPVELKRSESGTAKRQVSTGPVNQPDEPIARQQYAKRVANSSPKHWSALENYYNKLKAQAGVRPQSYDSNEQILYDYPTNTDIQQQQQQQQLLSSAAEIYPPYGGSNLANSNSKLSPLLPLPVMPNRDNDPFNFPTDNKQPLARTQLQQPLPKQSYAGPACRCDSDSTIARLEPIVQQLDQSWPDEVWPVSLDRDFMRELQLRQSRRQDMFGSYVGLPMQEQFLQDELNCGPRNRVRPTPASASRRLAQQGATQTAAGFGEYPSHMGLYNGSKPNDDNFLCSATMIHPRFALTLASCLVVSNANYNLTTGGSTAQPQLTIQAGDWNINRGTQSQRQATMATRPIARVHPFPRFNPLQPNEHNLALVEWAKPLDFVENNYINPACQVGSRSSLRMSRCLAPIRNVTLKEEFDAEGDGETKLNKLVQMVEMPINLIAHDDFECRRQTQIESFNFQRPYQICSGDFRQTSWRNKLKQSQYLGSGIYCNENGMMNLVSLMSPIPMANATATDPGIGYLDLSFYRPWIRNLISASTSGQYLSLTG